MREEPEEYRTLVEALLSAGDVRERTMMGMPSLTVGGRLFAGLARGGIAVKVGRERVEGLRASGRALPFDPSGRGRPMKDWALVPPPADDWQALAEEAKAFTAEHSG